MFAQNAIGFWSASASASASYPACIDDGHHWWYDATDLTTVTKDGSDFVSLWKSKGITGSDLAQAAATRQPLWVAGGTIRFDGVDNALTVGSMIINQPWYIYMLVKALSFTDEDRYFSSFYTTSPYLKQETSDNLLRLNSGASLNNTNNELNVWKVIRCLGNGVNSKLGIDANVVTGNLGTAALSGLSLAAWQGNSAYANIEVKDIICCDTTDAANETEIYNWLVTRKP